MQRWRYKNINTTYKIENIQKILFGNTKDGNILTSSAPLIYKIWNTNTKYEINKRQNIQKIEYGNTKDGNIFTSSAPLIYGDYYTKLRGRTLTKCNICFYSPFTINANRTTISSVKNVQDHICPSRHKARHVKKDLSNK